mmetsp:Transcript_137472/g.348340  ORF Transcript_137472/g.348340 Transcript_137472/m.348340 type:complete len:236 (-) Transcript_137472:88-795(-)
MAQLDDVSQSRLHVLPRGALAFWRQPVLGVSNLWIQEVFQRWALHLLWKHETSTVMPTVAADTDNVQALPALRHSEAFRVKHPPNHGVGTSAQILQHLQNLAKGFTTLDPDQVSHILEHERARPAALEVVADAKDDGASPLLVFEPLSQPCQRERLTWEARDVKVGLRCSGIVPVQEIAVQFAWREIRADGLPHVRIDIRGEDVLHVDSQALQSHDGCLHATAIRCNTQRPQHGG